VPVGGVLGGSDGDCVGIIVGEGVVGAGVLVVGTLVGAWVGPWVGTQFTNGFRTNMISSYTLGRGGESNSFHSKVP